MNMSFYKISDICKRRRTDGPTPCWYPDCDCANSFVLPRRSRLGLIWDGFVLGLASPAIFLANLFGGFR